MRTIQSLEIALRLDRSRWSAACRRRENSTFPRARRIVHASAPGTFLQSEGRAPVHAYWWRLCGAVFVRG